MISPTKSFNGWNLWQFIKGRKKTVVTIVAAGLGYVISDSELVAVLAGSLTEMLWGIAEFYFKKVNV